MSDTTKACCIPGCAKQGAWQVEDGKWLCDKHMNEYDISPENMAQTRARSDLDDFLHEGGKLS